MNQKPTLCFDMDGTIANLYSNPNWLSQMRKYSPRPYAIAKPMCDMRALARRLNNLQKMGYRIAIISWLSKESNKTYDEAVIKAKTEWLAKHLGSVKFDEVHFVKYGKKKSKIAKVKNGVLFDDSAKVRKEWIRHNPNGWAFAEKDILEILEELSVPYNKYY